MSIPLLYDALTLFCNESIDATDVDLPWELLRHPLTLRLFCEVTNPGRADVVGIERMPGSLTALFDGYLEQAAERMAELAPRTRRYYEQDVRSALNEIGTALWAAKARSLDFKSLRQQLADDTRPWDESIVHALEQDGVLLRVPGDTPGRGHVAVVYDALAGHVVADALLAMHGQVGLKELLRDPAIIRMFTGPPPDRHPLVTDILRALAGLVPRRLHGQQLWPLLNEPLRGTALRDAAELEGDYLDAATIEELRLLASQPPAGLPDLFDRLWQTRAVSRHPLNAGFLDSVLRPMSVVDRDLRWTEWVRRNRKGVLTDLQRLERQWRSRLERSSADVYRARWAMWTLTSTVHILRDQATRTLYWFGRGDPAALFELSLDALSINDPYVLERMLAACYGVAMARQYDIDQRMTAATMLQDGATKLYEAMFAPAAPHATTHWLARNYAGRIIEIAARVCPDTLSSEQIERTRPPYLEGGIRDWGRSEDKNDGEYRDGNHPFDLLNDDPMSKLGPGISRYETDTPQYKEAEANLWWRIYDLGYSLERCGSVDLLLASQSYSPSFGAEESVVDWYGRKYCWIATCELAGYRDDLGLLRAEWDPGHENWTHVDLDPSFPEELTEYQLECSDLLGSRQPLMGEWITNDPDYSFEGIREVEEIDGKRGPWVLLNGYVTQRDEQKGRLMFCFSPGAFVDDADIKIIEEVTRQTNRVDIDAINVPEVHYTYAGEIPWCETYRANEPDPIRFRTRAASPGSEWPFVAMTPAITTYGWESHHSALNPSSGAHVPARQIADVLGLTNRPQTFDLYDPEGRRASVSFVHGKRFANSRHEFTYLRKALLDRYLEKSGQCLIWVISGERSSLDARSNAKRLHDGPTYVHYEQVRAYR